jgi:folate-binding protein YgfZ
VADQQAVWVDRDVIGASGPEANVYLQGQLSQDVSAMADGATAWSWLLSPQGKVDALVRVTRRSADDWLIDTDTGYGEVVVTRLDRFKLRSKVEFEILPWRVVRLVGATVADGDVVVPFAWGPATGVDLFGPAPVVPGGWEVIAGEDYEGQRIRAGFPKMGAELTDKTIPAEVGHIDATVSFTKGCYTGQELVARIDSRGSNVARHLRGLVSSASLEAGAEVVDAEGKAAGTVTSVASTAAGWVGLGYIRRSVAVPGTVWADGAAVDVEELPQ